MNFQKWELFSGSPGRNHFNFSVAKNSASWFSMVRYINISILAFFFQYTLCAATLLRRDGIKDLNGSSFRTPFLRNLSEDHQKSHHQEILIPLFVLAMLISTSNLILSVQIAKKEVQTLSANEKFTLLPM